jgi:hypothetical protein
MERRAGVQARVDPDRAAGQGIKRLGRGAQPCGRIRECHEERVALGVDLDAAVASEGGTKEAPVFGERFRVVLRSPNGPADASSPRRR